ncbi:MAG: hypothetical protein M3M89_03100 [Thermoproteota archaeon]|nr:hypothetical protein [Thermoproteota archaeon]
MLKHEVYIFLFLKCLIFDLHLFGKRQVVNCAVCGRELGRHKYKPSEEWGIEGMLCGVCHVEKTKEEFILEQKEEVPDICAICKKELLDNQDRYKPRWQWEMESGTLLCKSCYQKKDADYNKKLNFCTICSCKLGLFYYHPKPAWKIDGNLCRKCWDRRNNNNNSNING